jgi:hypothetical protein
MTMTPFSTTPSSRPSFSAQQHSTLLCVCLSRRFIMSSTRLTHAQMEADQLLQLVKSKPPAKVDGLLHFMNDMQHGIFNADEQRAMADSASGRIIARAIMQCDGLKRQAKEKVQSQQRDEAVTSTMKYMDCLSYVTCNEHWKRYTKCWAALSNLSTHEIRELRETGALEYVCRDEKRRIEHCVGGLVSATVRAADEIGG